MLHDASLFYGKSAGAIGAVAVALPLAALLGACSQQPLDSGSGTDQGASTGATGGSGGTIESNPIGKITLPFTSYPQLANAGGSVKLQIETSNGAKSVYVTRLTDSSASTLSTICTHEGCTVNAYDAATQ